MSSMTLPISRKQLADLDAALSVTGELPRRGEQVAGGSELELWLGNRQRLAVHRRELGLGVERVDVRNAAVHEQEHDPLGPRREVRLLRSQRIRAPHCGAAARRRAVRLLCQQPQQGHMTEAAGGGSQNIASREEGAHGWLGDL